MQFSHLHNHTQFSLLDGASPISKLYKKAAADNMPGVAITDHGNMFGVFKFVSEAWKNTKEVGTKTIIDENGNEKKTPILEPVVKPIVGCEFYMVDDRHVRSFTRESGKDKRYHQLFLAKDETGYKNLTKLCSLGYIEGLYGKYPRIDKELVQKHHEGLIATTCCIGAIVPQAILYKTEAEAEEEFKWWLNLFGEDYYVEIQNHFIPEQQKVNEVLLRFAKKYNVPIIASNDSHYVDREDYNAHDILLCINTSQKQSTPTNKEFSDNDALRPKNTRFAFYNDEFYFKKTDEMLSLFKDIPEAVANTQMIVDKVKPLQLKKDILLPHFKVPAEFNDNQDEYLEHITWTGARERYKEITPEIEERLNFELYTIRTMGFAGYFLIVADFILAGKDLGVFIGPGRGSAAGSVVAYCIGITNIDPIKYNLLFERFLNPDRKSMPDIDTDFDDSGRQKVIDYVVDKYGANQVAHIITYGTMAAKMSIKDVARVKELPLSQSNALAKLVPDTPGVDLLRVLNAPLEKGANGVKSLKEKENLNEDDIANVKKLRSYLDSDEPERYVLEEAVKLVGSVRNTGIHAAGIIIAPQNLSDLIPVCKVKDTELLITQYDGKVIEDAGVIKMDFLGLKTLSILKDALRLIKNNHNKDIEIDNIPLDDTKTYELYQSGATNGTFQFESPGMQKHLRNLKPDTFADLIAMNALYRPGPLQYIPNFISRKHGLEEIVYDLPEMEEYLADTYGITVYQEQVMLLSQKLAGFSKGDADVLRKAMGKKLIAVLEKLKPQFIEGAMAKGHPKDKLEKIWNDWEAFAQYAFNKSHSTCYAFVAYQTAYLKAHYPAEFMAAVLNNTKSTEKITFFMEECRNMGIEVQGPDVNESDKEFSVNQKGVIRFGLSAIKGVGDAAMDGLVEERERSGPYKSIFDILMRNNTKSVNKKSLEALTYGGAFDSFSEYNRKTLTYKETPESPSNIDLAVRFGTQYQASMASMGNSLFGDALPVIEEPSLRIYEEYELHEFLEKEKHVLGFFLTAHPLDTHKFEINHLGFSYCKNATSSINKPIKIAGYLSDVYHGKTSKGDGFGRFTINDFNGSFQVTLWQEQYVKYSDYLVNDNKVWVRGIYTEHKYRKGQYEFVINEMNLLSKAAEKMLKSVHFYINKKALSLNQEQVNRELTEIINYSRNHSGSIGIALSILDYDEGTRIQLDQTVGRGIALTDDFKRILSELELVQFHIETK